ncbi:hypothetical protein P3W45_001348 [Vairimorpha bombi]
MLNKTESKPVKEINIKKQDLVYVDGTMNHKRVNIPFDTGASHSIKLNTISVVNPDFKELIMEAHYTTGHICVNNTYNSIKKHQNVGGITRNKVREILVECQTCAKFKQNRKFKQYPTTIDGTFLEIGIGCIGPLPKSSSGNQFIVFATDYYTKWIEGKALKNNDQGLEFTNKLVRLVSKLWESRFRHSSPYHPQTNGLAEKNQTIINKISKAMEDYKINWDRVLPYVLMQYRVYLLNPPDDFELYFIDPITYIEEKMNTLKAQGEIVELTNQKKERY